ncbi:soluble quino protein glucose dehydrogenase [Ophiobolus disseminans]|uniref:Soluble quino protein glucose dehydrogenase n=1 Tax=Ophiobolus disseminans TaxID=1469910 RepID=A0A6A7A2W2_9PLEO|nr:soluble quino protein glucose dehydrogenase [Ophiobolus disseminans]
MVRLTNVFVTLSTFVAGTLAQTCATINPAQAPTFASGYSGRVVINGLKTPRDIIFDKQGNLLTTEQGSYGVNYIQLTDNGDTDVCVNSSKQLISDATVNHGIALSSDSKRLWDYDGTNGTVSKKKILVYGMKLGGYHLSRTLLIPKGRPDLLLARRGSQDNIDNAAGQIGTARSQIRVFKIADIEKGAVEYSTGEVLAWGIRNTVGVGEDSKGGIWAVENGMDDMSRNGKDIHNTQPLRGVKFPRFHNPKFHKLPHHMGFRLPVLPAQHRACNRLRCKVIANATAEFSACSSRVPPKLCFPAHIAPLDIKFNPNGSAAYVSFHGSWNKSPPDGFCVSRVAWNSDTGMPSEPLTSTTAAKDIMWNADNAGYPNSCFRPVGLAWDAKGRLYMASDGTNEMWVLGGAM